MGKFIPQKEALHGYPPRSALCMSMDAIHYTGDKLLCTAVEFCCVWFHHLGIYIEIYYYVLTIFTFWTYTIFLLINVLGFFLYWTYVSNSHNFAPINIYLQDIFNQLFCICTIFLFFVDITLLFFTYVHLPSKSSSCFFPYW